jgi:hypothetical protein
MSLSIETQAICDDPDNNVKMGKILDKTGLIQYNPDVESMIMRFLRR